VTLLVTYVVAYCILAPSIILSPISQKTADMEDFSDVEGASLLFSQADAATGRDTSNGEGMFPCF
jgi:hypothetical protein